jgi:hypothetical protein
MGAQIARRAVGAWERLAPWIAGAGAIVMLVVPIGGYVVIHDSQQNGQAQVAELVKAFKCQQKAFDGLLQDVPLAFSQDANPHDYATIAKMCRVVQEPSR